MDAARIRQQNLVKTGGRAVVRATLLLFFLLRCLFYNSMIAGPVEYTSAGVR